MENNYILVLIDTVDEFEEHIYGKEFQHVSDAEDAFWRNMKKYSECKLYKGENLYRYARNGVEYHV